VGGPAVSGQRAVGGAGGEGGAPEDRIVGGGRGGCQEEIVKRRISGGRQKTGVAQSPYYMNRGRGGSIKIITA
jgi:hypothetical protein